MRSNSVALRASRSTVFGKSFWIISLLLTVVLFHMNHNIFTTLQETPTAEEQVDMVKEGSLARRVGLLSLGLLGLVNLSMRPKKRFRINGLLGWLLLFFIYWSLLTVFWSTDQLLTIRRLFVFFLFITL